MIIRSPFDNSTFDMPEPGTMPRNQFDEMLRKRILEQMAGSPVSSQGGESAVTSPRQGGGLGNSLKQAIGQYTDSPPIPKVKAGLMPEQVTALSQQALAEQQMAENSRIANQELAMKQQYADVQRQQAQMGLQEQKLRLAQMFLPKPYEPDLQVVGNTVMDMNDPRNVGATVPEEGMDAYQREQIRLREAELGLRQQDSAARLAIQRASLALRGRGGGGGSSGWSAVDMNDDGVKEWVNTKTLEIRPTGMEPTPETPEPAPPQDIAAAYELANETRFRPALENIIRDIDPKALDGLAAQFGGPKNIPPERLAALAARLAPEETAKEEAIRDAAVSSMVPGGALPFQLTADVVQDGQGGIYDKRDVEIVPDPVTPPALAPLFGGMMNIPQPAPKPVQQKTDAQLLSEMLGLKRGVSVHAPVDPYGRPYR